MYSEAELVKIRRKAEDHRDKDMLWSRLSKGFFNAAVAFAVIAIIYWALVSYYGPYEEGFVTGALLFTVSMIVSVFISWAMFITARKYHRKALIAERFYEDNKLNYKNI